MDLDGTGREGLGGRFAPVDGNPEESERQPGLEGGKGLREALPGHPFLVPGLRAERPNDPACPTYQRGEGLKQEGGSQIPHFCTQLCSQCHSGRNPRVRSRLPTSGS